MQACHFDPDGSISPTCPHELTGLTCPTHERLREFTKDGSRSPTCPHESTGPTCPTRDPLTSLLPCSAPLLPHSLPPITLHDNNPIWCRAACASLIPKKDFQAAAAPHTHSTIFPRFCPLSFLRLPTNRPTDRDARSLLLPRVLEQLKV